MREAASFIASQHAGPFEMGGLAHSLLAPIRGWYRRRKLVRLMDLDDHLLEDIGVTRDDVRYAFNLPLGMDAALELEDRALRRGRVGGLHWRCL